MLSKSLQTKINSQLCRSSLRLVNSKLMGYSQMISWFWRNSSTHKEVYQISVWQIARYGCLQRSWSAHFFGDDEKIIPPTWNNLDKTTMKLMGCPLVIGPDPSLYVDLGMAMNITNLYRTRFTTSHWQQSGIPTVPVFTFGDIQSLSYCLDGFPEDSVVALTGVGHERSISSEKLWLYCVNRMIEEKHPRMLIIYGGTEEKYNSLGVPYKYIPDHIHSKLRSL